jgi:multidrug efflux pump subunit AcrB
MLNKIEEMVDFLNEQPNANEGFSAKMMFETGVKFGLTYKETFTLFLGKDRAISRGKYAAIAPNLDLLKLESNKPARKAAAKKPAVVKAKKHVSSLVVAEVKVRDDSKLAERRELIAKIARRNKAEDDAVNELSKGSSSLEFDPDRNTIEALDQLMKSSTVNPLSA